MTEHVTRPPGAATSAPIPTNHVHETGSLRPVWSAVREETGVRVFKGDVDRGLVRLAALENVDELLDANRDGVGRWEAVRDLLLREQEDESALVDELVLAGWHDTTRDRWVADKRREIVRRILAAQKKRAES